ncbi:1447_t:CDS:2 [Entrophospora sp. SA101]|nr:1447_t:CDS:2 [Entrophospora sp. SA101]CAJ0846075.1 4700_t:CDS:2 [Entrophospora sp. SA101]
MWTDDQLRLLIDERENRNGEYYNIPGSSRVDFWNNIAITINQRFGTTYTGQQCNNRFQNLVREYNSMCQYIAGSRTGKRSRAGERFFEDFNSHFWERPETPFDILHNTNTSTKRRRRNRTPPPSYEVSTILSTSRRESTTNQRNRSASPTQRATSERNENNSETATTNNNQDNRRNENTTETATTNNNQDNRRNENTSETVTTGNNQDNGNNVNNVNDVSQPPSYMESINEERNP